VEHGDRFDEKLTAILRHSAAVFAEKGFDRASVRDIASATGVSLSGLYYYFRSKDELLFLLQSHCFDTLLHRVEEALEGVEAPRDQLRTVVQVHLEFFAANMAEMKVLSHEDDALTGEFRAEVDGRKRVYSHRVEEIVRALLPASSEMDPRVATYALFGMMNWIYTWYRPDGPISVEALQSQMFDLFLAGLEGGPGTGDSETIPDPDRDRVPSMWGSQKSTPQRNHR